MLNFLKTKITLIMIGVILVVGAAGSGWVVVNADRQLREDLLLQEHLVTQSMRIEPITSLSGSQADLASPDYQRVKALLASMRKADPQYRFLYLLGRKSDGTLFIFVDSEPVDSPDYSPPGQVYSEAPDEYQRVFDTQSNIVAGPVTDRWGTWVSALMPLVDPASGEVIAVIGMDVAAGDWNWNVAARSALPIGLLLALLLLGFIYVLFRRKVKIVQNQQEKLHESEDKYGAMFAALNEGVVMQDAGGKIINNNPAAELMLGLTQDQMMGRTSIDPRWRVIHADGSPFPGETHPAMVTLRTGQPARNEVMGVHKPTGELSWLNVNSEPMFNPGDTLPYAVLTSFADISRRMQVETALQQDKDAMVKLLSVSQGFLENADLEIDYQGLTNSILQISGGKFAVFNLFDENGKDFQTVAISGLSKQFQKVTSALGFELRGKKWPQDEARAAKIRDNIITHFPSLLDLAGNALPKSVLTLMRRIFNPGEAVVAKISADERMLGDFTIIMSAGENFSADNLVSIYLHQVGLLLQRKQAEFSLRKSQQSYRELVEQVPEVIYTDEIGGGWHYLGPNIQALCGYSVDELKTDPHLWEDIIHAEDREDLQARIKGLSVGNVLNAEYRIQTRAGGLIWVRDHGVVKEDGSTGRKLIQGLLTDITKQKESEAALHESDAKMRAITDSAREAILMMNPEGWISYWNPAAERMLGYTSAEAMGQNLHDLIVPRRYHQAHHAAFPDFQKTGQGAAIGKSHEVEAHRKNGTEISVQLSLSSLYLNEEWYAVGIISDITERKQAEEEKEKVLARLRTLSLAIDQSPVTTVITDLAGRIVFVNPKFTESTGYSAEEAIGKNPRILKTHHTPSSEYKVLWDTILSGQSWHGVFHNKKKTGELYWESATISPVKDEQGNITHFLAVKEDITARRQADLELLETNRQLEDAISRANTLAIEAEMANIAKSEFLANMSHEIRTPMNGVIGMTGLLLDTHLDEEQRRYTEIVRSSGESLLTLINDILDFSKIEAGKLELETLDFDLLSLLDDFAANMAMRAHEKRLELLCAADPGVPALLRGDPGRLRQILTNLVGNAVKFTQQGEVAVRVASLSQSNGEVELRFSVRDTGIGIPDDKLGLLFNKFSQVDASTTRQFGGTGLGLAISKQLAELMGGQIGVESEAGRGSEFWFTVRLGEGQLEGRAGEISAMANLRGVHILVVDDNATSREILNTRLTSWGMRPAEAIDGASALQALTLAQEQADPFQIAVLDMQMPGMDGATLGQAIKNDENLAGTHLVLLSSLGERGDARRFEKIGFSGYLVKPLRHTDLFNVLSTALAVHDGRSPARDEDPGSDMLVRPIITRHSASETLRKSLKAGTRILLAEDNITNQQVALGILKKFGLSAEAVANGAEALKALESVPYDLVLMDVQMPVMGGLEATSRIRDIQSAVLNHHIPIVAMTANAMQGDRERCLEAGMNDYVSKPVEPQALAEVLQRWLPDKDSENPSAGIVKTALLEKQTPVLLEIKEGEGQLPVFDKPALMKRLMGDEELANLVISGFLEDIPLQIQALKDYLDAGEAANAERQAHSIKGAAANLGAEALRATAFEMEKNGKAGNITAIQEHMGELAFEFSRLREALEKEI